MTFLPGGPDDDGITSRGRAFVICVLLVVGTLATGPGVGATSAAVADGPTIREVTFPDGSVADQADGRIYVWKSALDSVTVHVDPASDSAQLRLCVEGEDAPNGTTHEIGCREEMVFQRDGRVRIPTLEWAANQSGERTLSITLADPSSREVLDRRDVVVVVVTRNGDLDSDGLTDEQEFENGTGVDLKDTDKDGLLDGTEVREYGTDPLSNDTDGDGLQDAREINGNTNATSADTDGDGLTDGEEVRQYRTDPISTDSDDDGLTDREEVERYGTDPTSADSDGDGLTDREEIEQYGTDPDKADTDGDGLTDGEESDDFETDPLVADTDGDGLTDGEEVRQYGTDPMDGDTDGDLLGDGLEVTLGTDPTSGLTTPLALAGIAAGVLGVFAFVRSRDVSLPTLDGGSGSEGGVAPVDGDDDGDTVVGSGTTTETVSDTDPQLLTDEDRVVQILEENGGRLQQSEFVERTDWSKSKVSRLLSRMAEDGEVEKITLGRENLIALKGEGPEGAKSPFEE